MDDQGRFDARQLFQDFSPSKFVVFGSLLLQSIILSLRLDHIITTTYWLVFFPLWLWKALVLAGALVGYVVYRRHPDARFDHEAQNDIKALTIAAALHAVLLVAEILIVLRLEGLDVLWLFVFLPLFVLCVCALLSCIFSIRNKRDVELEVVICVNVLLLIFVALRLDNIVDWTWAVVFIPLWIFLVGYILITLYNLAVSILVLKKRMHVPSEQYCSASVHGFVSAAAFVPLLIFAVLFVKVLDGDLMISFSALFVPLHISLLAMCITSLYKRNSNHWWFGIRTDFCSFLLVHCSLLQEYGNIVYQYKRPTDEDLAERDAAAAEQQRHATVAVHPVQVLQVNIPD